MAVDIMSVKILGSIPNFVPRDKASAIDYIWIAKAMLFAALAIYPPAGYPQLKMFLAIGWIVALTSSNCSGD